MLSGIFIDGVPASLFLCDNRVSLHNKLLNVHVDIFCLWVNLAHLFNFFKNKAPTSKT